MRENRQMMVSASKGCEKKAQRKVLDMENGNDNLVCETEKETQMYRTVFWTLWERERVDDLGEWH